MNFFVVFVAVHRHFPVETGMADEVVAAEYPSGNAVAQVFGAVERIGINLIALDCASKAFDQRVVIAVAHAIRAVARPGRLNGLVSGMRGVLATMALSLAVYFFLVAVFFFFSLPTKISLPLFSPLSTCPKFPWPLQFKPDSESYAICLHNAGRANQLQGRYAEARDYYLKAIRIQKKATGKVLGKTVKYLTELEQQIEDEELDL